MSTAEQQAAGSGLLTDLYQLTMLDAYLQGGMLDEAVFEFFVRRLPSGRSFLMCAGLESTGRFSSTLLDYLADFRFSGEVRAMREGTVFFAGEPIVQVRAPLPEAQLIETRLINLVHFQTLIASKAARCVLAAGGRTLIDFGLRRAHGAEAGLLAARAAYLAGFDGTSTVAASARFGVPIYGTMAHSYVEAHDSEMEAFERFARTYPDGSVLLIDTYDTQAGARTVTRLKKTLQTEGIRIRGVRLDSGDLPALSASVRGILDAGGCEDVEIFCSGGLDEYSLACDFGADVPVKGFGIGTKLDVSADAPYLDCAYKLQEYAGIPRRKKSPGKATWPGRKQVHRATGNDGIIRGDAVTSAEEQAAGSALLETVMQDGRRMNPLPDLDASRRHAKAQLASLPVAMHDPFEHAEYPVTISKRLRTIAASLDRRSA